MFDLSRNQKWKVENKRRVKCPDCTPTWKNQRGIDVVSLSSQKGISRQAMVARLIKCGYDVEQAMDDSRWSQVTKRAGKYKLNGKNILIADAVKIIGASKSTIGKWLRAGITLDEVAAKIAAGEVAPVAEYNKNQESDWSAVDNAPRRTVFIDDIPGPTRYDEMYGHGPVNEMDTKI